MLLSIKQLSKPIDCYVVLLEFYSGIDRDRLLAVEPIAVWFDPDLAEQFSKSRDSAMGPNEKLRVAKIVTNGVAGLQAVIDRITADTP